MDLQRASVGLQREFHLEVNALPLDLVVACSWGSHTLWKGKWSTLGLQSRISLPAQEWFPAQLHCVLCHLKSLLINSWDSSPTQVSYIIHLQQINKRWLILAMHFQSHLAPSQPSSHLFFPPVSVKGDEMLLNRSNGVWNMPWTSPHRSPHQWNNKIAKTKGSEKDFPWHDDVRATASVAEFILSFQRKLLRSWCRAKMGSVGSGPTAGSGYLATP